MVKIFFEKYKITIESRFHVFKRQFFFFFFAQQLTIYAIIYLTKIIINSHNFNEERDMIYDKKDRWISDILFIIL